MSVLVDMPAARWARQMSAHNSWNAACVDAHSGARGSLTWGAGEAASAAGSLLIYQPLAWVERARLLEICRDIAEMDCHPELLWDKTLLDVTNHSLCSETV